MTRIEHEVREPATISNEQLERDLKFGYAILEYNPERVEIIEDSRTKKQIRRTLLADINYRCMRCQFDTLDKELIEEHMVKGPHAWAYSPFENPYGHIADVVIEGIEDYSEFIAQRR